MILGKLIRNLNKYLSILILLFLGCISFFFFLPQGKKSLYTKWVVWEAVNGVPVGIYYGN